MSDALTAQLDEIEAWAHIDLNDCKIVACPACRYTRAMLALVAAVRATEVHRELWNTSPMDLVAVSNAELDKDAALHAIEELKL